MIDSHVLMFMIEHGPHCASEGQPRGHLLARGGIWPFTFWRRWVCPRETWDTLVSTGSSGHSRVIPRGIYGNMIRDKLELTGKGEEALWAEN